MGCKPPLKADISFRRREKDSRRIPYAAFRIDRVIADVMADFTSEMRMQKVLYKESARALFQDMKCSRADYLFDKAHDSTACCRRLSGPIYRYAILRVSHFQRSRRLKRRTISLHTTHRVCLTERHQGGLASWSMRLISRADDDT